MKEKITFTDAFGLSEFLRNECEDTERLEEKTFGNFTPLGIELKCVKQKKKNKNRNKNL